MSYAKTDQVIDTSGMPALEYRNLCEMHRSQSLRHGQRTAVRYKAGGVYQHLSWQEYRQRIDAAAFGLMQLGVQAGDRVAILSENRIEWLIADHSILSAGGVVVPLHAPLTPRQVKYILENSGAVGLFVSNQEQAQKLQRIIAELPSLRFIVTFDPIEPFEIHTLTWSSLLDYDPSSGVSCTDRESELGLDSLATIVYTSGTTGNPKGVMLSHGNLLCNATASLIDLEDPESIIRLSWLPLTHIYARQVDHFMMTLAGGTVVLSTLDTLLADLKDQQATWLTSVPRFYEKVWSSVVSMPPAERNEVLRNIFGPSLTRLSSGGAPLAVEVIEGFREAGLPEVLEGYGLTESSPVITRNITGASRPGSVGTAIAGAEIKIAHDGEILTRGPHVMQGYWNDPEATAAVIDREGWLYTGDVGHFDTDGYLYITDRKKDLIITAGGKNISPMAMEQLLSGDRYINMAIVHGDGMPFITALIVPDFQELESLCKEFKVEMPAQGPFISDPAIIAFYEKRVAGIMEAVSNPERVHKFILLSRPLTLEGDELTATFKIRRRFVIQKFENEFAALYDAGHLPLKKSDEGGTITPTPMEETQFDLAKFHECCPFARLLGIEPGIANGNVVFRLTVEEKHLRSLEMIHGGAIAALMDTALGVATCPQPEGFYAVTVQLNVNFIRPARLGETLTAESECDHRGTKTAVVRGEIRNENGDLIAVGSATMMYLPLPERS